MKRITPLNKAEFHKVLSGFWKVAKTGKEIPVVRIKLYDKIAELTATDKVIWLEKKLELKEKPNFSGTYYLCEPKDLGIKKDEIDLEPALIAWTNFPDIKDINKPIRFFRTNKKELQNALKLISALDKNYCVLKLNDKTGVLFNNFSKEVKHKFTIKIESNKGYVRLIFSPTQLLKMLENMRQEIVSIYYSRYVVNVGDNFLACVQAKK